MNQNGGNTYRYKPSGQKTHMPDGNTVKRTLKIVIAVLAVFLIAVFIGTCFYTVADREVGVVTTFGKVTDITDAGLHFKAPFGIQQVRYVATEVSHRIELGYVTNSDGSSNFVESESKIVTGDYNIVNVDFFISYRITNPEKYLYSSQDPELILKMLAQSQIRNVIGSCKIDSILTEGKAEIQQNIKSLIIQELEEYDIGISLTDINIQDSEPPTAEVSAAFKSVETAKQGAETAVNEAEAYKNSKLPKAESEANKLLENAEYLRQNRINEATEQVARFNAMYEQYILNPEITKVRMFYETMENVLPGVTVYIDAGDSSIEKLLPLDKLVDLELGGE